MGVLNKLQESNKAAGGDKKYNAVGVVLEVSTAVDENGSLKLTGKALNGNSQVREGEEVTVVFRGDNAAKSLTNFVKGNGKKSLETPETSKGTFVTLESCYATEDMDGDRRVLSARWVNTLASSRSDEHDNRSFLANVLAMAPRISFANPEVKPGEPERITLPISAKTVTAKVKNSHGTFDKEFPASWAVEKLNASTEKPTVTVDIVEPDEAVSVSDRAGMEKALADMLGRGTKALAMLRVSDGEDVLTRAVYVQFKQNGSGEYVPDVEKSLDDLFKNNIFKGVPNEDLFNGLKAGGVTVEAVPGYRMTYAGDPSKDDNAAYKLVNDVKAGNVQRYEMIFGSDANRFAKVILPGIARNDSISGFSPFNIVADEVGTFLASEFSTAHISPNAQPKLGLQPADPSEPAPDFAAMESAFDAAVGPGAEDDTPSGPRP